MRTLLAWIGTAAVLAVLVLIGFGIYAFRTGAALDREAAAYANDAFTGIAMDWNAKALTDRESPSLAASTTPKKLAQMFAWFVTLGHMTHGDACQGGSNISTMLGGQTRITAAYHCDGQFEHAPATVSLSLVKDQGRWMIAGLHVDSPALMPKPDQQKI